MTEKIDFKNTIQDTVVAYFDLEFCNERISRHNVPIAIGVTYRLGEKEIGTYDALIWYSDEVELWQEQLDYIGYSEGLLQQKGKTMEQVTKELFDCHEKYQPEYYISFGKQDEDLLKKFVSQSLLAWTFCDAIQFLPKELSMKYDISLEKYAYICQITFVHEFDPLEDARSLGTIVFRVLKGQTDEARRREVAEEYNKKMFLIEYQNKKQAYEYLSALGELTPRQRDKLESHRSYLNKNHKQYLIYTEE